MGLPFLRSMLAELSNTDRGGDVLYFAALCFLLLGLTEQKPPQFQANQPKTSGGDRRFYPEGLFNPLKLADLFLSGLVHTGVVRHLGWGAAGDSQ